MARRAPAHVAIDIDKSSSVPIYQQVYEAVRDKIALGSWQVGDKLPSIRALSAQLDVARNTVDNAYKQLVAEGYVESKQGSGYIVLDISRNALASLSVPSVSKRAPFVKDLARDECAYDFSYGSLVSGTFPLDLWRKAANEVLTSENAAQLASYQDRQGELGLRQQIASFLKHSRDINCTAEQIVITSGAQNSLRLLLDLFDSSTDRIALEDPCFDGAHVTVRNADFQVDRIRADSTFDTYLADVVSSDARLFYTTPSHQFPMGWCMAQNVRAQLLSQTVEKDTFIIEDDYDSGYRYATRPVPALHSMDRWGRVIYMGTFSKILSPALRLSFLVLPPELLARYHDAYQGARSTVSWLDQKILERFMESGEWDRHRKRTILAYRKRYRLLKYAIAEHMGDRVKMRDGEAGLFMLLEVNAGMNQDELVQAARDHDVRVIPANRYWLDAANAPDNLILLGFSSGGEQMIREGIPRLAQAWFGK